MKAYQISCPACGASVSVEEGQMKAFCTYCGSQLQIDNQIERKEIIYKTVDEAEILKEQNRMRLKAQLIRDAQKEKRGAAIFLWILGATTLLIIIVLVVFTLLRT